MTLFETLKDHDDWARELVVWDVQLGSTSISEQYPLEHNICIIAFGLDLFEPYARNIVFVSSVLDDEEAPLAPRLELVAKWFKVMCLDTSSGVACIFQVYYGLWEEQGSCVVRILSLRVRQISFWRLRLFKEIWFWWLGERAFWRGIGGNIIAICGLVAIRCCVACISSVALRATISRVVSFRIGIISFFSSSSRFGAIAVSGLLAGCWVTSILLQIDNGYIVGVIDGFGSIITFGTFSTLSCLTISGISILLIVAFHIHSWVGFTFGISIGIQLSWLNIITIRCIGAFSLICFLRRICRFGICLSFV